MGGLGPAWDETWAWGGGLEWDGTARELSVYDPGLFARRRSHGPTRPRPEDLSPDARVLDPRRQTPATRRRFSSPSLTLPDGTSSRVVTGRRHEVSARHGRSDGQSSATGSPESESVNYGGATSRVWESRLGGGG